MGVARGSGNLQSRTERDFSVALPEHLLQYGAMVVEQCPKVTPFRETKLSFEQFSVLSNECLYATRMEHSILLE